MLITYADHGEFPDFVPDGVTHLFALMLNDMRASKIEIKHIVAVSELRSELEHLVASETVEPYSDGNWGKSFRRGGPLEWCNPPYVFDHPIIELRRDGWRRVS